MAYCGIFSTDARLGQTTLHGNVYQYLCTEKSEVSVCVIVFVACVVCGMMMKGKEKVKTGART